MRIRKNAIILDTETVGDFAQPLVHDWGWVVVDKDFNTIKEVRYLVKQTRDCKWAMNGSEFYKTKASLYDNAIANGEVEIKPWGEILAEFKADMKRYNVKVLCAYNVAFDYKALNFTNQFYNNQDTFFTDMLDKKMFLCIWNMACETILNTEEYKEWCTTNNRISTARNYQTSAEVVYQYLFGNLEHKEEHTALQDSKEEAEMLKYMINNVKGNANYGLYYNCWAKLK